MTDIDLRHLSEKGVGEEVPELSRVELYEKRRLKILDFSEGMLATELSERI